MLLKNGSWLQKGDRFEAISHQSVLRVPWWAVDVSRFHATDLMHVPTRKKLASNSCVFFRPIKLVNAALIEAR